MCIKVLRITEVFVVVSCCFQCYCCFKWEWEEWGGGTLCICNEDTVIFGTSVGFKQNM